MQSRIIVNNMASRLLFGMLLAACMLPAQAKMYKWVDSQGNVHYTDALPPTAAGQGNAELSKTGNVVNKTESAEERAKRLAAEAEAAERNRIAQEQARKDRALLATYSSEKEIDLALERTLEHYRLTIDSAASRLKQIQPMMTDLGKKVRASNKGGKTAPAHLQQQYDARRDEVVELERVIKTNEDAMAGASLRYEADKQRFRELTVKP